VALALSRSAKESFRARAEARRSASDTVNPGGVFDLGVQLIATPIALGLEGCV
jgi:hypothetical protein